MDGLSVIFHKGCMDNRWSTGVGEQGELSNIMSKWLTECNAKHNIFFIYCKKYILH